MVSFDDFKKIELITARIKEVEEHPDADRLYVVKVETGDGERQLVAGIRLAYTKEELVGRTVAIVANLEPAVIRGVESQGMILAASGENGPVFLTPEKDVPPGSPIR